MLRAWAPWATVASRRWLVGLATFLSVAALLCAAAHWTSPGNAAAQQRQPARQSPRTSRSRRTPAQPASERSAAQPTARDIVAVVNDEAIVRQQLAQECLRRYGEELLESMVNKQLILAACRQRNIEVTQADVDREIQDTARKINVPADQFLTMLEQERNMPAEKYRREVVWPMLALQRLAADKIQVSQQELEEAFETEYGPRVRCLMIATRTRSEAESLRHQCMEAPETFGQLAKEHSIDPNSAASRGVIPPIRKHIGFADVERVAFGLKEDQISEVIEIPDANQFLILKCERQVPPTFVVAHDVKEIKQRLAERIRYGKLRQASGALLIDLQKTAKIVNVYNDTKLRAENPDTAAIINGRSIPLSYLADECLAYYGREVLQGEINRKVISQALARASLKMSREDMETEVLRAADAYGYIKADGTPDRDAWIKSVEEEDGQPVDIYMRDVVWPSAALKKLVHGRVEVTDEDMQKGFVSNYGERVEVQVIVCTNQHRAVELFDEAKANNTEAFFGQLAYHNSVEPMSRANYGKVPPIRRYSGHPTVEDEAFRLKPGELSGVVASGDKFILMRCLGRTKPVVTEFAAVKGELMKMLHEKKLRFAMDKEMNRLYSAARIENYLERKVQLGAPRTSATPASAKR